MGNQSLGGGRGVRQWMRGYVVAMGVADDCAGSWLPGIEPEFLVRQIDAAIPENGVDRHVGSYSVAAALRSNSSSRSAQ